MKAIFKPLGLAAAVAGCDSGLRGRCGCNINCHWATSVTSAIIPYYTVQG